MASRGHTFCPTNVFPAVWLDWLLSDLCSSLKQQKEPHQAQMFSPARSVLGIMCFGLSGITTIQHSIPSVTPRLYMRTVQFSLVRHFPSTHSAHTHTHMPQGEHLLAERHLWIPSAPPPIFAYGRFGVESERRHRHGRCVAKEAEKSSSSSSKAKKHGIAQNAILQQRHRFTHCERRPL